jgi:site-specific recombinase XerD
MPWPVTMVPFGKRPRTLPTVLSRDEIDRLLQCTPNLKHRTFLMVLYSAGLRFSEAAHLRISDIDSARMQIRVACGKGKKERLVPSPCGSCRLTDRPRRTTRKRTIRTHRTSRRKVNRRPDPSHRSGVTRQEVVALRVGAEHACETVAVPDRGAGR